MTSLNVLIALLGAVTTLLGAILSVIALRRRILAGLAEMVRDVLLETGLTKFGRPAAVWPNGSTNLPDFLEVMWAEQKKASEPRAHRRTDDPPDHEGTPI